MRLPEHVICGSPIDGLFRMAEGNWSAIASGRLEDLTDQKRGGLQLTLRRTREEPTVVAGDLLSKSLFDREQDNKVE